MNGKLQKDLKVMLEKEKEKLENQLNSFAKKDKNQKGDWDTSFPHFNKGVGSQGLEEAADEVEEYMNLLPIEANYELRLKAINSALEKIKKGKYGNCEKCEKPISQERLKAYPEAQLCVKCRA
ncbi:TraR/DksA family transcriptional regulator [Patescibacteria group bacterium]